jgi:hypothetical protein
VPDPTVPADLSLLADDDLTQLESELIAVGERLRDEPTVTAELVQQAIGVRDDLGRVRGELALRAERARLAAEAEARRLEQAKTEAMSGIFPTADGGQGEGGERADGATESGGSAASAPAAAGVDPQAIAAAAARGTVAALAAMGVRMPPGLRTDDAAQRAAGLVGQAARTRPRPQLPETRLQVHAGVDIPGVATNGELTTLDALTEAFQRRAKAMGTTRDGVNASGQVVATVRNDFEHVVDDRNQPAEIADLLDTLLRPDAQEALLAGGGWCAPSEIRYDFFNIACTDGLVDLPTVGISRGGIRWPTSPSLADVVGGIAFGGFSTALSVTSDPFLWTESDDVATVTGGPPTKPTVRVPCPGFNEQRLECYGLQVTAGNLTDDAYPEATRNFLRLMIAAHEHAMNGRILALMVAQSSAAVTGGEFAATGNPVFHQVVGGLALAATDYRNRYGMCEDDVLEVVGPRWVREALRADLAWRQGVELLDISNAQIDGYFAARRVRPQWVDDWQVRSGANPGGAAALTAWPTTADFLVYAAGTFLRGDGLTLDLGVIRDSVLNSENDFTAAFSEECHLVARVGHESRRYTIGFNVNGASAPAVTLGANL